MVHNFFDTCEVRVLPSTKHYMVHAITFPQNGDIYEVIATLMQFADAKDIVIDVGETFSTVVPAHCSHYDMLVWLDSVCSLHTAPGPVRKTALVCLTFFFFSYWSLSNL